MDTKYLKTISQGILMLALLSMFRPPTGGAFPALAAPGDTTRVSVDSSGAQATVALQSLPSPMMGVTWPSNPTPATWWWGYQRTGDIFVHDRQTGTTTRVSVEPAG